MVFNVCKSSLICFKFLYLENSTSIFGKCLRLGSFTPSYMISQLYIYPDGYGVLVLVGLMLATIICYVRGFVTCNQVAHNNCNMGTHGLPDYIHLNA